MIGIGLNPSTADENIDDATIRILIALAQREGFGQFCMLNLFAWRATDPTDMKKQISPVGIENDEFIRLNCLRSDKIVACWGTHGNYLDRGSQVERLLVTLDKPIYCVGVNADGTPKHPLYSRKDVKLEFYKGKVSR